MRLASERVANAPRDRRADVALHPDSGQAEDLGAWLRSHPVTDEDALADLIEADGRDRCARGLPTPLERYLDAAPQISTMPTALDAAIEAAIRWMCSSGSAEEQAIASLVDDYPELSDSIIEAVTLNRGLWSTRWLIDRLGPSVLPHIPCDFGPEMRDGRRRYRLTEILGRGSCGEVCLGVDQQLSDQGHEALVAVKLFDARGSREDVRRRFIGEAARARRVEHPAVVKALERGETEDGILYIVYEYVRGKTLARWLREQGGRVEPREAARIVARVAEGVQAAHAAGLIHCDLHPTNVLIDDRENPHICDFGIAVLSEELASGDAADAWGGRALGSLAFIPPEQYRLEAHMLGAPADVYSLAGLLHFLLTGDLPNGASADEIRDLLERGDGAATRVKARPKHNLDRDLDAIRLRALDPDPARRHPNPAALAEDLNRWLDRRPIEWTQPSPLRRGRLLLHRRPVVFALTLVALAALVAGASALSYTFGVVHSRRQGVMTWYRGFQEERQAIRRESDGAAIVLDIWVLDKILLDKAVGGHGVIPDLVHAGEIDTIERMVNAAYEQDPQPSVDVLYLETTAAYLMLVNRDLHPQVRNIIRRNRAQWARLVPEGSNELRRLDVLDAAAVAKQALSSSVAGKGFDQNAVRAAAKTLLDALPTFDGYYENSPYHVLAVRALRNIYGGRLLRDAVEYEIYNNAYLSMVPKSTRKPSTPTPDWNRYDEWKRAHDAQDAPATADP